MIISRVPIGYEDGLNLCQYCKSNSFRYTDVYGQFSIASLMSNISGIGMASGIASLVAGIIWNNFEEASAYLDGTNERSWWVHCYFACNLSRDLGLYLGPVLCGVGGEIIEMLQPSPDSAEDLIAYAYGSTYAAAGFGSCADSCSSAYPDSPETSISF